MQSAKLAQAVFFWFVYLFIFLIIIVELNLQKQYKEFYRPFVQFLLTLYTGVVQCQNQAIDFETLLSTSLETYSVFSLKICTHVCV